MRKEITEEQITELMQAIPRAEEVERLRAEVEKLRAENEKQRAEVARLLLESEVLAKHEGSPRREWHIGGAWLYPGDSINVVRAPLPEIERLTRERNEAWSKETDYHEGLEEGWNAAAAENERLRAALENIVGHWNHAHDEALKRWEGSSTQAFEDLEYVEAADIKPLVDIARAALEAKP